MFFEVCNKCRMTFTDEKSFFAHNASHNGEKRAVEEKPIEKMRKAKENQVPGDMNEDERLEKIRAISEKRKKLINAGIEAATMRPEEVEKRFAEEFGKKER